MSGTARGCQSIVYEIGGITVGPRPTGRRAAAPYQCPGQSPEPGIEADLIDRDGTAVGCNGDIDGDPVCRERCGSVTELRGPVTTSPSDICSILSRLTEPRISDVRIARRGAPRRQGASPVKPFGRAWEIDRNRGRLLECRVHDATVHEQRQSHRCRALRAARPGMGIRSR